MTDAQRTIEQRVSDAELQAMLRRYGNNKAGDVYRALKELDRRRQDELNAARAKAEVVQSLKESYAP